MMNLCGYNLTKDIQKLEKQVSRNKKRDDSLFMKVYGAINP